MEPIEENVEITNDHLILPDGKTVDSVTVQGSIYRIADFTPEAKKCITNIVRLDMEIAKLQAQYEVQQMLRSAYVEGLEAAASLLTPVVPVEPEPAAPAEVQHHEV